MISLKQIDAAIVLLGLKRADVAQNLAINPSTFSGYFVGRGAIPSAKLTALQTWFEDAGLVFTQNGGVDVNRADIVVYRGRQGFISFMDDVYEASKQQGGNVYLFNSRPRLWHEWLGKDWYAMHAARMAKIAHRLNIRIIVEDGDEYTILGAAQHRWFPKGLYQGKIFYAYGDKLAFLNFTPNNLTITVVREPEMNAVFCTLFEVAWDREAFEKERDKQQEEDQCT